MGHFHGETWLSGDRKYCDRAACREAEMPTAAVPQPVERAVCNACGWEGEPAHDICPACGQDTLNYFTPVSGSELAAQPLEPADLLEG